MNDIKLISLHLQNFMGVKDKLIEFDPEETTIQGANATGKTTINTAFRWLLFNKDVNDRKEFGIKTIDKDGKVINGLQHTVTAEIKATVQGKIQLSKTYKEIWRKKKGEPEKKFSGHETLYYIDEVPTQKKEYDEFLRAIIDEETFKVITDPLYFSEQLHWKDRRDELLLIAGDIPEADVIASNNKLKQMDLNGKSLEDFKKMLAEKRRKLNNDLQQIPPRIDEVNAKMKGHDYTAIHGELKECEREFKELSELVKDPLAEDPELKEGKEQLQTLRDKIDTLEDQARQLHKEKKRKCEDYINELLQKKQDNIRSQSKLTNDIEAAERDIRKYEEEAEALREAWNRKNEEELQEGFEMETTCPTCKQKLPEDEIEQKQKEIRENFNKNKAEKLEQINKDGREIMLNVEDLKKRIEENKSLNAELRKDAEEILLAISTNEIALGRIQDEAVKEPEEIGSLRSKIQILEEKLLANQVYEEAKKGRERTIERMTQLQKEIDGLKEALVYEEIDKEHRARIIELKEEERKLAQQVADLEKQEYYSDEFVKAKVALLQEKIDGMFTFVDFKLFDVQVNGAIDETCTATIEGVPFADANRAAQVNAGIDIINTLNKFYSISAPIFIDNRESITDIISSFSQIINLKVKADQTELAVIHGNTLFNQE